MERNVLDPLDLMSCKEAGYLDVSYFLPGHFLFGSLQLECHSWSLKGTFF